MEAGFLPFPFPPQTSRDNTTNWFNFVLRRLPHFRRIRTHSRVAGRIVPHRVWIPRYYSPPPPLSILSKKENVFNEFCFEIPFEINRNSRETWSFSKMYIFLSSSWLNVPLIVASISIRIIYNRDRCSSSCKSLNIDGGEHHGIIIITALETD